MTLSGGNKAGRRPVQALTAVMAGLCLLASGILAGEARAAYQGQNGDLMVKSDVPGAFGSSLYRVPTLGKARSLKLSKSLIEASFSPDGKTVAGLVGGIYPQVWMGPARDEAVLKGVTDNEEQMGESDGPVFSPDGRKFYSITTWNYQGIPIEQGLVKFSTQGGEAVSYVQLTPSIGNPQPGHVPVLHETYHLCDLSPDGKTALISFQRVVDGELRIESKVMDLATGQTGNDPLWPGDTYSRTFLPDGKRVLFYRQEGETRVPYIGDLEGGEPEPLALPDGATGPEYSPDGTRMAYVMPGAGVDKIVLRNLVTGTERQFDAPGTDSEILQWTRQSLFRASYLPLRKRLRIRVFNPGRISISGPGIEPRMIRNLKGREFRIPLIWTGNAKSTKVTVSFKPDNSVAGKQMVKVTRRGRA